MNETATNQHTDNNMTNEHLANERTLLAWVRTAIGIMAFGFVVVKFSLFIRQMAAITGTQAAVPHYGFSGPVGILLVVFGGVALLFGTWRYYTTERRLRTGKYGHSAGILYGFIALLIAFSIALIIYLVKTT
jgi:putative membrane protein